MQANQVSQYAFFCKSMMCPGFLLWFLLSDAIESVASESVGVSQFYNSLVSVYAIKITSG